MLYYGQQFDDYLCKSLRASVRCASSSTEEFNSTIKFQPVHFKSELMNRLL